MEQCTETNYKFRHGYSEDEIISRIYRPVMVGTIKNKAEKDKVLHLVISAFVFDTFGV